MFKSAHILVFSTILFKNIVYGINNRTFPKDFMFGVATAAYQVEGGWNADGKGENIWDRLTHTNPSFIHNNDSGDIACDMYHKWNEDIERLKYLGVNHYRFSISWSRVLPNGYANKFNEAGVNYYKNLIKELKKNNIEPVITLFHWDTPQPLQDIGGWPNPLMVDYYADYARFAFKNFGDDVRYWITFNEPRRFCGEGYGTGALAPAIVSSGIADYLCTYTVILAHAKAYHLYDEEFRSTQNGYISIVLDTHWAEPASQNQEDVDAADRSLQFTIGVFANPIYNGNWPQTVIDRVKFRSEGENFFSSRLPELTPKEIDYINGTYDYFALNTYDTYLVQDTEEAQFGIPSRSDDERVFVTPVYWNRTDPDSLVIAPRGLTQLLHWIEKTYNNPKILITENGLGVYTPSLEDDDKVDFLTDYFSAALDAIYEDNVNLIGYTIWSFMDDFEWMDGYSRSYGLYHVDFTSDNRTRTARKSVDYYKNVIATHCLVDCSEESVK